MSRFWKLLRSGISLFSWRGRTALLLAAVAQVALVALDALGLLLLASSFEFTGDPDMSGITVDTTAVKLLTIIALFIGRSALSSVVSWFSIQQLMIEESRLSISAFRLLLDPSTRLDNTVDTHFHNQVDRVPEVLIKLGFNGSAIVAELLTMVGLLGVFVMFDPLTASISITYFVIVVITQYRTLAKLSYQQGDQLVITRNELYRQLTDAAHLRKSLSNTSAESLTVSLGRYRSSLSKLRGHFSFLTTVPRYLLEITLALGILLIGGVTYLTSGPEQSLSAVVLFTGVSFRLLPVVNRIQSLALMIVNDIPTAKLISEKPVKVAIQVTDQPTDAANIVELSGVGYRYPDSAEHVLHNINIRLSKGKQYAIVGPSGAGKTTLADVILGLLQPSSGVMRRAKASIRAYVPQEIHIAFISLAENVALVWNRSEVDYCRVESALRKAGLHEFLTRIDDPTPLLNESLSGGQRQRIGLARAFYSGADLIILDEVTSALDSETEKSVVEQIYELRGNVTAVIIAHRLSTVQHADHVFYLENGQLIGSDTFQVLAGMLPQFRHQIELGQIRLLN